MARRAKVPNDPTFFELFERAAANLVEGASLLADMLRRWPDDAPALMQRIRDAEHTGDRITQEIVQRLNATSATPIDREDVLELASALDDVADLTEEVGDLLGLYRIEAPMEQAIALAEVLQQATRELAEAVPRLRDPGDLSRHTAAVGRLENEGDRISRDAIASLFDTGIDPMVVIRWKDIFERLEDAIDATERVANTLEAITIKNG